LSLWLISVYRKAKSEQEQLKWKSSLAIINGFFERYWL
jgi:hypothetical protein